MLFTQTTAVQKIAALRKRTRIIQGGSSAGKTIALLLILIDKAQSTKGLVISIVSESLPHLKKGAIRDFLSIMEGHGYFKEERFDRTNIIYNFETGSKIEFFGADNAGKVRGPRRDILFINEANALDYDTYTQLVIRTKEYVYLDYNPVQEFWVHTDVIPQAEHDFLVLTYLDNEGLSPNIIKEIESRKGNKNFWQVYGLGQLGVAEGKIFKDWQIVDEIPHEARLERRGLDFGYTNDPTAIVDVYKYNGGYILDELCYERGMSNRAIGDFLLAQETQVLTVADSSEPKSIDELKSYRINIIPAMKGQGSVLQGIQFLQDQRISMTRRSVNLIKEYRNYLWLTDKNGKIINEPEGGDDHLIDAVRYALEGLHIHKAKPIQQFIPKPSLTYGRAAQRPQHAFGSAAQRP